MKCYHGVKYANASDEELMAWFYACDETAFNELWDCRYWKWLFGFVRKRVNNADDAADIVQNVGLKVAETKHKPSARYNPTKSLVRTWIMRITKNEIADYFHHKRGEVPPQGEGEEMPEVPEELLMFVEMDNALDAEKRMMIRNAVRRLEEPCRTVVELHFWEGYTLKEIAKQLGYSVATVHRYLQRCLGALRTMLKG